MRKATFTEMPACASIFESGAEALVCPVNCAGVMGAGLAKEFRVRFPGYYEDYRAYCVNTGLAPGKLHSVCIDGVTIISFPTMLYPGQRSQIEFIRRGLNALAWRAGLGLQFRCAVRHFESVAIPGLGCGIGRLPWGDVRAAITEVLGGVEGLHVELYPPRDAWLPRGKTQAAA